MREVEGRTRATAFVHRLTPRLGKGGRTVAVVAATAAVALVAGLVVGRLVTSPAEAAAEAAAPAAGLITVPAEMRTLSDDVTLRGDVQYDDPTPVTVETGDREEGGPAVVTGGVPEVGTTLEAGDVLLEVTGRPVLVLPGELPVYRTLRLGLRGPDVLQLKQALAGLGLLPGEVESDVYDGATAGAVRQLFDRAGYAAPSPPEGSAEMATEAERSLAQAEADLATARAALDEARSGPSRSVRVEADNAVREQERQLAAAREGGDPMEVAAATDALALARVQRDEALAVPAPSAERQAVTSAEQARTSATEALAAARDETVTPLPASEVVFLPSLPRRVDEVLVERGGTVSGAVAQVSGATLEVVASAATGDAQLLEEGMAAVLQVPDGETVDASVSSVEAGGSNGGSASGSGEEGEEDEESEGSGSGESGGTDRARVSFTLGDLTDDQLAALQGQNVRITVPVSSTSGEVLAVPLAALTAGAGGESRVEVSTGQAGETELVTVTTGLAADGYAEITGGDLAAGDLVVVGR
ncbi:hypothetical protein [Pseudokineococcus sp. 1T1Z-3]|uniref:hypothetical protein n=1 Tax=Pseudokineococcus sp. 1T1Z-3 TaxID=3132745 RepID=UPI0030AA0C13